jgi:transcriptional regulator with XRE-family HTH domain
MIHSLTHGEAFFIWRHRRGLTQEDAGALYRMNWRDIARVERNVLPKKRGKLPLTPPLTPHDLLPHEEYTLLRRRRGWSQKIMAKKLRCCRYWVRLMENGSVPCNKLAAYWNEHTQA